MPEKSKQFLINQKIPVEFQVKSLKTNEKKLTSAEPHNNAVATMQVTDVVLLDVTEQTRAPTVTDARSFRKRPAKVIERVPVVEQALIWRPVGLDEPPQETVWTIGDAEQ